MKGVYLLPAMICLSTLVWFPNDSDLESLKFLCGAWRMESSKSPLFEEWVTADNSTLKGRSYKLKGADTMTLEHTSIVKKDGGVYYIALVQNQNNHQPVTFKLVSSSNQRFVFENKEHDYPQRVIYRMVNNDSVVARIEGSVNGMEKFSDFYYGRIR